MASPIATVGRAPGRVELLFGDLLGLRIALASDQLPQIFIAMDPTPIHENASENNWIVADHRRSIRGRLI